MNRKPVESSNLKSVGYQEDTQILEVEFKQSGIYRYFDVPETEYKGLMNAESHGKYLNTNIKSKKYRYKKIFG